MAKTSFVFFAGLLFLFVVAIPEIEAGGAIKLCEKNSQTYTGKCENKACDKKCMQWEKAMHGVCHVREAIVGCYCYYDCTKAPPASKPAPPEAAIPLPPAPGGGGAGGSGAGGGAGGADGGGAGGGADGGARGGGAGGDGGGNGGADGGLPPSGPCHCRCMKNAK